VYWRRARICNGMVGHWWKRGRRGRRATFSPVFVSGEKPFVIAPSQMPVWRPFRDVAPAWPKTVLSGHQGLLNPPTFCSKYKWSNLENGR
jgi:hypothetical protein